METCRVCLKESDTLLNFTSADSTKFLTITGIHVNDLHDEFLCENCLNLLDLSYKFRDDSIKADKQLNKKHKNIPQNEELEPMEYLEELELIEEDEDEQVSSYSAEIEPAPVQKIVYKCPICDMEFRFKKDREKHQKGHHKSMERTFVCEFEGCGKKFGLERYMQRHMKDRHMNKDKYICELCAMRCISRNTLKQHMRTHTDERPYVCKEPGCNKAFRRTSDLYYHTSSHSEKRNHVCIECGAAYKLKFALLNHMKQVHKVGAKLLKCPECEREYLFKNQLDQHISIIHRGERNYVCEECGKSYGKGNHLKRHYHDSHPELYEDCINRGLHQKKNSTKS